MSEVNTSMNTLASYPNGPIKSLMKEVLGILIEPNENSVDVTSLKSDLRFQDDTLLTIAISEMKFFQVVAVDNRGKISLTDRSKHAFPLNSW